MILDRLLFAVGQVISAISEDELQMGAIQLSDIMATYNSEISCDKTRIWPFVVTTNQLKDNTTQYNHRTDSKF
jgi:hypothetical protein